MSDVVAGVRKLAHSVDLYPHVEINGAAMDKAVRLITNAQPCPVPSPRPVAFSEFLAEVCFAASNYCFWSFDRGARPGGGSTGLHRLIREAFGYREFGWSEGTAPELPIEGVSDRINDAIWAAGFPLANQRIVHIAEVFGESARLHSMWTRITSRRYNATKEIEGLLEILPSFGEDPFLKRALFFPMLLHRLFGTGNESLDMLPVPADYSLPKVLRALGVLVFSPPLCSIIDERVPIAAGSATEAAIRASTILACEQMALLTGISEERIDCILWMMRNDWDIEVPRIRTTCY